MSHVVAASRGPFWMPVLAGGLVLGTIDIVFACGFWALLRDIPPARILQSIAAGIQGSAAFSGGQASAMLGLLCHYVIAIGMVLAYVLVSQRWRALIERPVVYGLLYGLLLYVLMSYVVVPLSNAPQQAKIYLPWVVASIVMHALLGVICAWAARSAHGFRR